MFTISDDDQHNGEIRLDASDGGPNRRAYGPAGVRVDNGAWHHVVAVVDRDVGITLWVDGISGATAGALTGSVSNGAPFMIGKSGLGDFPWFSGLVDEVAVYPSVLSSARIAAHRNAALGTNGTTAGNPGASAQKSGASPQLLGGGTARAPF